MQVYSFVAPQQLNSWSGDVKQFFTYLQYNKNYPADSQYLISTSDKLSIREDIA
jgi:xyloglucan-specific endo-beta-1,4-glucanase